MKTNKQVENLVQEVLNESSYLERKQCYYTAYFWLKNPLKYSAIFSENLEDFTNKVRETSSEYLNSNNIIN
jgi:hypothetical protein